MTAFITAHWVALSFGGAYFFVAAVSSLPLPGDPRPVDQKLYEAFYVFLHIISNRVVEKRGINLPSATKGV